MLYLEISKRVVQCLGNIRGEETLAMGHNVDGKLQRIALHAAGLVRVARLCPTRTMGGGVGKSRSCASASSQEWALQSISQVVSACRSNRVTGRSSIVHDNLTY